MTFDFCSNYCESLLSDCTTEICFTGYSSQPCFCFDSIIYCPDSSDYAYNAACVELLPKADEYYRVSCKVIPYRSRRPIFVAAKHHCNIFDPGPTPYPVPKIADNNFQASSYISICQGTCSLLVNNRYLDWCILDSNCFCSTDEELYSSDDCQYGESWVKLLPNADHSYCVSCTVASRWLPLQIPADTKRICEGGPSGFDDSLSTDPPQVDPPLDATLPPVNPTPDATLSSVIPTLDTTSPPHDTSPGTTLPSRKQSLSVSWSGSESSQPVPRLPVASSASYTEGDEFSGICAAIEHIEHLPGSELVYESHWRAHVHCNLIEICATPGRMVLFEIAPMTKKTYCETIFHGKCDHRIMFENSLRTHRHLWLGSSSPGL